MISQQQRGTPNECWALQETVDPAQKGILSAYEASAAFQILAETADNCRQEIHGYPALYEREDSDEVDNEHPVLTKTLGSEGINSVLTTANSTLREVFHILDLLSANFAKTWNICRGRHSTYKAKILFMTLTVLKLGGSWDWIA